MGTAASASTGSGSSPPFAWHGGGRGTGTPHPPLPPLKGCNRDPFLPLPRAVLFLSLTGTKPRVHAADSSFSKGEGADKSSREKPAAAQQSGHVTAGEVAVICKTNPGALLPALSRNLLCCCCRLGRLGQVEGAEPETTVFKPKLPPLPPPRTRFLPKIKGWWEEEQPAHLDDAALARLVLSPIFPSIALEHVNDVGEDHQADDGKKHQDENIQHGE